MSEYANSTRHLPCGVDVEYAPLGLPIFKVPAELNVNILAKAKSLGRNVNQMTSDQHMKLATEVLRDMMTAEAKKVGKTLEQYLSDKGFSSEAITDIVKGSKRINGYTWHHNAETGRLQLVKYEIHREATHNGGNSFWGIQ